MSVFASSRCCWLQRDSVLDSLELRENKGRSTWRHPRCESNRWWLPEQMIHGAKQRYPERLQTCQHLQLINVTRCLFLKSHPCTAAPHTHAQQKRKRRETRKGVPVKTARLCQRGWGGEEGERGAWAPVRIWSEPLFWPLQMRRGAPGDILGRCPNTE